MGFVCDILVVSIDMRSSLVLILKALEVVLRVGESRGGDLDGSVILLMSVDLA